MNSVIDANTNSANSPLNAQSFVLYTLLMDVLNLVELLPKQNVTGHMKLNRFAEKARRSFALYVLKLRKHEMLRLLVGYILLSRYLMRVVLV